MKTQLLLVALFISCLQLKAQTIWIQQYGQGGNLWAISFSDSLHGTACGNYGTLVRTVNGGSTWNYQNGPVGDFNVDIVYSNSQKGWIANFNNNETVGNILVTTD